MVYKIWDDSVLHSTRGDFYLEGTIPESFNLPLNQDGTEPVMTMQVSGETLADTSQVLIGLQDYPVRLSHVITNIFRTMREQSLVDMATYPNLYGAVQQNTVQKVQDDAPTGKEFAEFLVEERGWVSTKMVVAGKNTETGENHYVEFQFRTPGFAMIMTLLEEAIKEENIEALVLKAMPIDESLYGEDALSFHDIIPASSDKQQRTTVTPDYFS